MFRLDNDGITIRIILGNLRKEKTICKDTFTNIFSYQIVLFFCKIPMLLSLIRLNLGCGVYWIHTLETKAHMRLNAEGGYWAPILYNYCTTMFYLITRGGACTFLASEIEFFRAVVNYIDSVTIAIDSFLLGVQNLLLLITFVDFNCYYFL